MPRLESDNTCGFVELPYNLLYYIQIWFVLLYFKPEKKTMTHAPSPIQRFFAPEKVFLLFLFLRPTLDLGRDYTFTLIFAIVFTLWSIFYLVKYRASLTEIPGKSFLILFLVAALISVLYSVAPGTTVIEWSKLLVGFLFFGTAFVLVKNKKITLGELFCTLVVSAVIPIVFGILQLATQQGINTFGVINRIYGTFAHPNVFAFFLLFLFFAGAHYFSLYEKNDVYSKWLQVINTVLLFVLLGFTYTRAAWIGLLVIFFILSIFYNRRLVLIGVGIIALFYVTISPLTGLTQRYFDYNLEGNSIISRLTTRNPEADSFSWRTEVVRDSVPIVALHPVLGYGYGTFPLVWTAMRPVERQNDDSAEAHNDYLRLLVETGGVGLILYGIFLLQLLGNAWKRVQKNKENFPNVIFFGWIVVFGIVSLSDNMLHHTPVMLLMWSYWGAILALPEKNPGPNLLHKK